MEDFQVLNNSGTLITRAQREGIQNRVTMRSRGWTFTLHNYCIDDENKLQQLDCTYIIYGRESSQTGTLHLQGYVFFSCPGKSGYGVRKILNTASWFSSRGNIDQNIAYCSKLGDVFSKGNIIIMFIFNKHI